MKKVKSENNETKYEYLTQAVFSPFCKLNLWDCCNLWIMLYSAFSAD